MSLPMHQPSQSHATHQVLYAGIKLSRHGKWLSLALSLIQKMSHLQFWQSIDCSNHLSSKNGKFSLVQASRISEFNALFCFISVQAEHHYLIKYLNLTPLSPLVFDTKIFISTVNEYRSQISVFSLFYFYIWHIGRLQNGVNDSDWLQFALAPAL